MATVQRVLTARFEENRGDVGIVLTSSAGTHEQRVPLNVFTTSLAAWARGDEEDDAGQTDGAAARVIAALSQPEKWQVNALASPLRYALLVEGEWRVAVGVRPAVSVMDLRFQHSRDEGSDQVETYRFAVPPRVIAGVWRGSTLNAGIIALAKTSAHLPLAPNDALPEHQLTPWNWGNVSGEGQICWGSTTRPLYGQDGVTTIEAAFFSSIFNEHIVRVPLQRERDEDEDEENDDDGYDRDFYSLRSWHVEAREHEGGAAPVALIPGPGARTLRTLLEYSVRHSW